jgi:hypothetical protein
MREIDGKPELCEESNLIFKQSYIKTKEDELKILDSLNMNLRLTKGDIAS